MRFSTPGCARADGLGQRVRTVGALLLVAVAAVGCASGTQTAPATSPAPATRAAPATARPKSGFGQSLSLAMSFGNVPAAGDAAVTASFALTNNGSAVFDGCFGPSWGVAVIVAGHDAGYLVSADYPQCADKLTLLPGQKTVWTKKIPLTKLSPGTAKVTGWVKVIDPATCNPRTGCHEVSVATPLMTLAIGQR
jgi:hypothetical protein